MQKWFELEYAAYKNIRQNLTFILISGETLYDHPVIFRPEHPSILREAFLAMYRYVNVCKCKLISREHLR